MRRRAAARSSARTGFRRKSVKADPQRVQQHGLAAVPGNDADGNAPFFLANRRGERYAVPPPHACARDPQVRSMRPKRPKPFLAVRRREHAIAVVFQQTAELLSHELLVVNETGSRGAVAKQPAKPGP